MARIEGGTDIWNFIKRMRSKLIWGMILLLLIGGVERKHWIGSRNYGKNDLLKFEKKI